MIKTKRPRIIIEILELIASSSDFRHVPVYGLENRDDGTKIIWYDCG